MKRAVLVALIALYVVSITIPVYAATRAENNRKVADFVADIFKFHPLHLIKWGPKPPQAYTEKLGSTK